MAKIRMIFNPEADRGRLDQAAGDKRQPADEWDGADCPAHTCEPADAAAGTGSETVVALGGDGTVHEVVNRIMTLDPVRRPRFSIDLDGRQQAGAYLMPALANDSCRGGGGRTTHDAALSGGRLDFVPEESVSRFQKLRRHFECNRGIQARCPEVHPRRFRNLTIHSDMALPIQPDGELIAPYAVDTRRVTAEIVPAALKVIV